MKAEFKPLPMDNGRITPKTKGTLVRDVSPLADTLTPREFYKEKPRNALWDYWIKQGNGIWDEIKHSTYPRDSYAYWYAEAMRNRFWAWKDYRTQSLADRLKEGAD